MKKNNILLSFRLLGRDKLFSFINIGGLALGLACSILLFLWVQDEYNFNSYYEHSEEVHMVRHWQEYGNTRFACSVAPEALAPSLKESYPEIIRSTRRTSFSVQIKVDDQKFMQTAHIMDPDALEIFSFKISQGTGNTFTQKGKTILISEKTARKFFKKDDPIGKALTVNGKYSYTIAGVFKDFPRNVEYRANIVLPINFLVQEKGFRLDNWGGNSLYTFVQLDKKANSKAFEKKISSFLSDSRGYEENSTPIVLDKLSSSYLKPVGGGGRIKNVRIFIVIGLFILLIACFNYTNLTTAKASSREKEIGIRKAVTASRLQLIRQFLGESLIYTFLAINIGLVIARLFLPVFNEISRKSLVLDYNKPQLLIALALIWIATSVFAGIYPAIVLSGIPSISAMKSATKKTKGIFRKVLVSVQFAISIALVICVIIMSLQIKHLRGVELGINKDNLVYFQSQEQVMKHYTQIKNELLQNNNITSVTQMQTEPFSGGWNGGGWDWEGKTPEEDPLIYLRDIDQDFLKTFDIKLLEGNFYDNANKNNVENSEDEESSPIRKIVINKTLAKLSYPKGAVGQFLTQGRWEYQIIGVVDDYYFMNPRWKQYPLILFNTSINAGFIYSKIQGNDPSKTLKEITKVVEKYCPDVVVEHHFVDEDYEMLYRYHERTAKLYKSFAIVAILISCLGLFGLSAFYAKQRTKEIGIRKSIGAPVSNIISLLSKEILGLILIASLVACPFAWYYMETWLQDSANRINIEVWMVLTGVFMVLLIALFTILYQAYQAATRNPVESLRYE